MTVKELIEQLSKLDPELEVLGEFDSDGDGFMMKMDVTKVYVGDGIDDSGYGDENEDYCILEITGKDY
jgi:hypothetical protein